MAWTLQLNFSGQGVRVFSGVDGGCQHGEPYVGRCEANLLLHCHHVAKARRLPGRRRIGILGGGKRWRACQRLALLIDELTPARHNSVHGGIDAPIER